MYYSICIIYKEPSVHYIRVASGQFRNYINCRRFVKEFSKQNGFSMSNTDTYRETLQTNNRQISTVFKLVLK